MIQSADAFAAAGKEFDLHLESCGVPKERLSRYGATLDLLDGNSRFRSFGSECEPYAVVRHSKWRKP